MRWILPLAIAMALSAASAVAQPLTGADAARGAELFAQTGCAGCHGPGAAGGMAPPLLGLKWKYGGDDASVAKSIREGHLPLMPPAGDRLTGAQIDDVISYLRARAANLTAEDRARMASFMPSPPPKGVVHSDAEDFRVQAVAKVGPPYAFAFLPDGRILITETAGRLRVVDHGKLLADSVIGAPTGDTKGMTQALRRAMLSVAVHPDYRRNGWIYLLTARTLSPERAAEEARRFPGSLSTRLLATITRGRLQGMRWTDSTTIAEFPIQKTNSLRMKFDAAANLYVGTPYSDPDYPGEGPGKGAQDLSVPDGKVLRFRDDGSVPSDNPFVAKSGAYPYIWSYGHREPSGLTLDSAGALWEVEDGPRGGDELNHVRKGLNYGWPIVSWGHRYDGQPVASNPEQDGVEQPVMNWEPSPAVSDIEYYAGAAFPRWRGNFFVGTMKQRDLLRVVVDGDRVVLVETLLHQIDRFRDLATGPDGFVYALTDSGDLLRLVPVAPRRPTPAAPP